MEGISIYPAEPIVSKDHCLSKPAQRVREAEDIYGILRNAKTRQQFSFNSSNVTLADPEGCWCQRAVFCVAFLRQRPPQTRVDVCHHLPCGWEILKQQENQNEFIKQIDPEDNSPKCRMRSNKWAIAELNHGKG